MGATSWRYYTAYDPDPEAALQSLRAEVFARGEYLCPTGPVEDLARRKAQQLGQDTDSPEVEALLKTVTGVQRAVRTGDLRGLSRADRAVAKRLQDFGRLAALLGAEPPAASADPPASIAELLDRAGECGTHSILDIEHTASRRGFGFAVPMTVAAARRVFGTTEPTHEQVEEQWPDVAERLGRWQACYVAIHLDGKPHEYAFIGCSGD